jgi:transcriptional regulator with XRE-family HTH domain
MTKVRSAALPDALDLAVAGRIRFIRKLKRMSQSALGAAVGVTFQQMQKYERGTNRVSAAALIRIAERLDVSPVELLGKSRAGSDVDWTLLNETDAIEMLELYSQLSSPVKAAMMRLIRELAREDAREYSSKDTPDPVREA